ncbi:hypothetical protein NITHO_6040002 [Nitrolancea hollandica Lb]|uniref:Uncharacterized protein n=1 Tax=Nitrolancea hollandica Lb TaxID=1129897 RepID=I4EMH5_9BACT|nr:hypothetical protein NITHO_6040002 [Nitrolancea hollandica Lb]
MLNTEFFGCLDRLTALEAHVLAVSLQYIVQHHLSQTVRSRADRHAELLSFSLVRCAHL